MVSRGLSSITFLYSLESLGSDTISLSIPGASMLVLHSRKDVVELLVKRSGIYSDRYAGLSRMV
jgi:hypothetical protein